MAVLAEADRKEIWAEFMRQPDGVIAGLTKAELRAAVDALDDYFNTNAAAINTAIPQPARGALTTVQKAKLAKAVLTQRYIKGS
mgnify:CR=1 FL=1